MANKLTRFDPFTDLTRFDKPFGNIAEDQHCPDRLSFGISDGRSGIVNWCFGAVSGDKYCVVRQTDDAVRRVLRAKFRAGLFDKPLTDESSPVPLNRAAARRMAQRAIVLLKNEGAVLPLAKSARIAVVGPLADSKEDMLGPWSGRGAAEDAVSVREGILGGAPALSPADSDVILAVFGETREMSGEAASRSSLDLPGVVVTHRLDIGLPVPAEAIRRQRRLLRNP